MTLQIFGVATALAEVINLGTLIPFLNILADPVNHDFKPLNKATFGILLTNNQYTLALAFGFLSAIIISTLLRLSNLKRQYQLVSDISTDIASITFESILKKPFSWHMQQNSGRTLSLLSKDIDQVVYIYQGAITISINAILITILGLALIVISPLLTSCTISILLIAYLVIFRFSKHKLKIFGEIVSESNKQTLKIGQEAFAAIRDIIIDDKRQIFAEKYKLSVNKSRQSAAKINIYGQSPRFIIEGFFVMFISIVAVILSFSKDGLSPYVSILAALALGSYRILQPLQHCFVAANSIMSSLPSFLQITEVLGATSYYSINDQSANIMFSSGNAPLIQVKDIHFKYSSDMKNTLSGISLSIKKGDKIAFVGPTGSGKSTLIDILLGLLSPTNGVINFALNESILEIKKLKTSELLGIWQNKISHVPQNIYIADDTIEQNIAFGVEKSEIDKNFVISCAKKALIHDYIESTNAGYNTQVGQSGALISGGQRQRLALARALYKKPDVLILDEATSALDISTERRVVKALEMSNENLTILAVAHRLESIKDFDNIYYIVDGKIVDSGHFSYLYNSYSFFRQNDQK